MRSHEPTSVSISQPPYVTSTVSLTAVGVLSPTRIVCGRWNTMPSCSTVSLPVRRSRNTPSPQPGGKLSPTE